MPRYEFVDGSSQKFWEIALEGTSFTTTYGRIGTDGQMSMKEFDSEEKAQKEYDKLIAEKTKKGYDLADGNGAPAAAKPAAPAAPAAKKSSAVFDDEGDDEDDEPKAKPAAAAKAAPAAKPAPAPKAAPSSGASKSGDESARYFEFVDGSSSKFWEIKLEGTSFTTRYGKIGTDGQMSMKEYDSDDKATREYEKLVSEKTKKGYVEK